MIEITELMPGVTLRCRRDRRFKQGCLSFQLVRQMTAEESSLNALLPAVLLRGTRQHPDLRAITQHLDELYGASVSTLVRRVGDLQTTGVYCGFMDDRFALPGDQVLAPMISFLEEILLDSPLEENGFRQDFVESEKKNLISTIESELNDKRVYAMGKLLNAMCQGDSFGLPRLGEPKQVARITAEELYAHYRKALKESPIHLFYVGSAEPERVAQLLRPLLSKLERAYRPVPEQTAFRSAPERHFTEEMEVTQGKLCMGFTTPIINRSPGYPAMQLFNTVFGAGMTSKLFVNVREKLSLCYSVGSAYYGTKGVVTVSAGIDFDKEAQTRQEILSQLAACQAGNISPEELSAAKEAVLSSLRTTHDSPGAIEGYYATAALSGVTLDPRTYMDAVRAVTLEQVVEAARSVTLHSTFFLKGGSR